MEVEVDGLVSSSLPAWLAWLSATGARRLRLTFASPKEMDADSLRVPLMTFLESRARVDEWADSQHAFDESNSTSSPPVSALAGSTHPNISPIELARSTPARNSLTDAV